MTDSGAIGLIEIRTTEPGVEYVVTGLARSAWPRRFWIQVERIESPEQVVDDALRAIALQQGTQ